MNLAALERKYGGKQAVQRRKVSPFDPRGPVDDIGGAMQAGARFHDVHEYAAVYEALLKEREIDTLVELGVLLGSGLAVWCDVFPAARIIGLDIDPGLFDLDGLISRGAFTQNVPEVHAFDELQSSAWARLGQILSGSRIDVFIDDALHDDNSIMTALRWALPYMADGFLYFIEDNRTIAPKIAETFPKLQVESHGSLTVLC